MDEAIKNEIEIEVPEKPYHFRKLKAEDVFLMFKIIKCIGIREFSACLEKENIKKMISEKGGNIDEEFATAVGFSVILEIADVVIGNLPKCENEIFEMLANVSGLSVKKIREFDIATFAEMVIDFIKKDDFKDFFKVVSKLFK